MLTRRDALKDLAAAITVASLSSTAHAAPAPLRLAIIGCGPRGRTLAHHLASLPGTDITHVCDPLLSRASQAATEVASLCGTRPTITQDLPPILDDPSLDALILATPLQAQAPSAIRACAAGKHVYLDAPCAQTIPQGRQMIEAAQKHARLIQVGTQARSAPHVQRALHLLHTGAIGDVVQARAWTTGPRSRHGQSHPTHALDLALRGLGVDTHPEAVTPSPTRTRSSQKLIFDFPPRGNQGRKQLILQLGPSAPGATPGDEDDAYFYGTKGLSLLNTTGFVLLPRHDHLIEERSTTTPDQATLAHLKNFLAAIRGQEPLRADITTAHATTTLWHLATIASRLRRALFFDAATENFLGDHEASVLLNR